MARLFDSFVMVDWSAASKPATGADSIWIGALTPDARLKLTFKATNPATRAAAVAELEDLLQRCLKRGDRVLLAVDFPLGFPAGTSEALGLKGATPWAAMRDFLVKEMKDKPDNANNRFALAARMNRLISNGPFPFWGCSKKDELTTLSVKKSREHGKGDLPEFRAVEETLIKQKKARPPQPVWKIAYAGAVGGQTLTGLPAFARLQQKLPGMKVWPFEIPLAPLDNETLEALRIAVVEVYPPLVSAHAEASEIRDEAQVRTQCEWLAELDASGKLAARFAPEAALSDGQKARITSEEGWILGI